MRRLSLLVLALGLPLALLGSAPAAPSAVVWRLVPPGAGQAYFGMSVRLWDTTDPAWGDTRPLEARVQDSIDGELAGKRPTFLRVWAPWQRPEEPGKPLVPFSAVAGDIARGRSAIGADPVLLLDWSLTSTTRDNGAITGITVEHVASGRLDGYVREYADSIRAYGRPVLVNLFGGEFNGEWWWGQSPRANPALTHAEFVAAWRRVVDVFEHRGALNVSWAWIANAFPPSPVPWVDPDLAAYYPGDAYVDWAGADVYDVGPVSWLDGPHAFAVAHGKPLIIGEAGIRHNGSTLSPAEQNVWLDSLFDYAEGHAAIKALVYFNQNMRPAFGHPLDPAKLVCRPGGEVCYQAGVNDMDHRLLADSGTGFAATFARRISSARYLSAARVVRDPGPKALATMRRPVVQGRVARLRWSGNAAARTYDVQVRRGTKWRLLVASAAARSATVRGARGERLRVRVRARNVLGTAGPWSASRLAVFR